MNKQKGLIISIIIVTILAICYGIYIYDKNNIQPAQLATTNTPNLNKCFENSKYFAIQKNSNLDAGSDILVKFKTDENEKFECSYTVGTNDFEVKNEYAEYFMLFTNNFLVLDSGTGPDRGLKIYDLNSRKKVYEDLYKKPVVAEADVLTYWNPTTLPVTPENCPEASSYISDGFDAIIHTKVSLDLTTLIKKDLAESQCIATQ
ncbi:hypothetical protein IPF86_03320 [Candidatus Nomurabacteria bacterium]|jgi:hypothetical protein|nr:MAG: hypothetical protein IPF86_03320 [Candidatus Nomurabacteria bacterium]